MPPVIDCEGRLWPLVRVLRGEMTCTGCGETAVDGVCPVCGVDDHGTRIPDAPPLVETISYLREEEYQWQ